MEEISDMQLRKEEIHTDYCEARDWIQSSRRRWLRFSSLLSLQITETDGKIEVGMVDPFAVETAPFQTAIIDNIYFWVYSNYK